MIRNAVTIASLLAVSIVAIPGSASAAGSRGFNTHSECDPHFNIFGPPYRPPDKCRPSRTSPGAPPKISEGKLGQPRSSSVPEQGTRGGQAPDDRNSNLLIS